MKVSLIILTFFLPFLHAETLNAIKIGEGDFSLVPDTSVVYKKAAVKDGEVELKIHGFLPAGHINSDSRPAVLFFHGGGWYGGTPDQFYPQCRYLALRGIPAYSASYRLIKAHGTSPKECVMDGKSAFRWLRKNAVSLGLDPEKLMLGGGSAGGHIASAVTLCEGFTTEGEDNSISTEAAALILYNPVFDNGPGGFGHGLVKEYWKEISPIDNIDADAPPSLVILGSEDKLLPVKTVERYRDGLKAHGIPCTMHVYEGKPHAFFNLWVSKPDLRKTLVQMDEFLVAQGLLKGSPLFKE